MQLAGIVKYLILLHLVSYLQNQRMVKTYKADYLLLLLVMNTIIIPTKDTISLIAPRLNPTIALIIKINIIATSKILIVITSTPYNIL